MPARRGSEAEYRIWLQRATASRRTVLRGGLMGAGALGLALAGCSSNNNKSTKTASTSAATQAATAAGAAPTSAGSPAAAATRAATGAAPAASPAAQQPRRGGKIQESVQGEPPNFDIDRANTAYLEGYGPGAAYSMLLKAKPFGHNNSIIPTGDVAEKWEQPDPTSFIFHLRPNIKFHNIAPVNGRQMVAQDIVYSFNRQNSEKINASFLAGVKNMTAPDPMTFRMDLDGPNTDFLGSLCDGHNKIKAHEAVEQTGDLVNGPTIGTGAWIFKEWQKGTSISLVRNPDYFIAGQPYADEFNSFVIKDPAAVEAQLTGGQLTDATTPTSILSTTVDRLGKDPRYKVYTEAAVGTGWVMLNLDHPEVKDPRVRQALSKGIDRQLIISNAFNGKAELDPTCMVLPGPDWQLSKDELQKAFAFDAKAATDMLKAAGGLPKQTLQVFNSAICQSYGQLVQANFKAIGIDCDIQLIDSVQLTGNVFNPAVAGYTMAATQISHGPTLTADLETWYKTGGTRNSMHLSDAQLDNLIDAQKKETDQNKRMDLVHQIQRRILELATPIPLAAGTNQVLMRATMQNFEPLSALTGEYSHYQEVWFSG